MKLPFIKKKAEKSSREYLFALEIGHEIVKSAIWSVVNNKTQVLSIGHPVSWDGTTEEQLITAGDDTLSDAATHLDQTGSTQPQKLVLGLPADWVADDKINPDRLKTLKELTGKLSLVAIGFVVTPQALVRHLQHVEGVPPTAILIGFGRQFLAVTLVRLGKINATHLVSRSAEIPADIIEGLSRFGKQDMLPSRILIYDSTSDLENIRQQLLSYPWQAPQTNLPFLHFPKVEVLPADFSIKAISLAGGGEVARAIGLIPGAGEQPRTVSDENAPILTPEDLGFIQDEDVAAEPIPSGTEIEKPETRPGKISLPHFSLPSVRFPRGILFPIVLASLVLLVSGLFAAYWYLPQATVTLTVQSKKLEQQFTVAADTTASEVDTQNDILPAKSIDIEISGTASQNSTGTKLVGDKAVGEVTIINGTGASHSFSAGTVIKSAEGFKFVLDSDIQVASASGTADPNSYQPGKANVKVTAEDIGSDSNLSAGTQFTVGSYSSLDFIAKNDTAFSGGSSRQVAAVSKDDLSALRSSLLDQLKSQASGKLTSDKLSAGEKLVDSSISFKTVSEDFDHEAGDEADQVSLDMTVKASSLAYQESQMEELISAKIASQIPTGYRLAGQPETRLSVGAAEGSRIPISVDVSVSLLPQIDDQQIARDITGLSPDSAKSRLSNIPNISQVSMSFSPKFPGFLLSLPHQTKNIRVTVQSD